MSNDEAWWAKTRGLAAAALVVLGALGYLVHAFATPLGDIDFLGFPLGFYMAAQGSLIGFVVLVFWFAGRQHAIDRKHGMAETD